jgi:hypothetical protein
MALLMFSGEDGSELLRTFQGVPRCPEGAPDDLRQGAFHEDLPEQGSGGGVAQLGRLLDRDFLQGRSVVQQQLREFLRSTVAMAIV